MSNWSKNLSTCLCGALILQKEPLVSLAEEDMGQKQADRSTDCPERKKALFLITVKRKQKQDKFAKLPNNTLYFPN